MELQLAAGVQGDLHGKVESTQEVMTCALWGSSLLQIVQSLVLKELLGSAGGEESLAMNLRWFK